MGNRWHHHRHETMEARLMPTIEHRGYLLHYQSNTGETVRQAPNGSVKVFASLRAAKLSVTKLTKAQKEDKKCLK